MERLTKRIPNKEGKNVVVYTMGEYKDTTAGEMTGNDIRTVLMVLAYYEDLEEQGLLLKLPCKIGDTAYEIIEETVPRHYFYINEYEVEDVSLTGVRYAGDWHYYDCEKLFFTREEADEALMKETEKMESFTNGNADNLERAVEGLDIFAKNWCMNCKETEAQNNLVFRCGDCNFAGELGECNIKKFVVDKTGDMPIDFGSMGSH